MIKLIDINSVCHCFLKSFIYLRALNRCSDDGYAFKCHTNLQRLMIFTNFLLVENVV